MFICNLNTEQQAAMLALAELIVRADDEIAPEEYAILASLKSQCSPNVEPISIEFPNLPTTFPQRASQASLILELLGVAYADAEYHESERGLIREIANALSLEATLLEDMELWVERQFIMAKEAQKFMED
ncbi:TerB family tellurite resistance protein [Neptuniibacter sp. QD48_11]|uniref:TerB family tellurite resistance protein n=1 Tax=Neptuniibacter sp. QD48_11 TaxID=3398211 RepID=UPI0039F497BA